MLFGRDAEMTLIDSQLDGARHGRSAVTVISGGPGIGKTALLRYAAERADDMLVLRGSGIETEAELPFAGLHLILHPVLDRLGALPTRQADALRRAFQLAEAGPAGGDDRFLVGLAVLTLLAEAAPLLCVIDDAHWLDAASANALLFTARRLDAEGVVLLIGTRDELGGRGFAASHEELRLTGLGLDAAGRLVDELAPGLSPVLRERILAEAEGNPLALSELAGSVVGRSGSMLGPLPAGRQVQQVYSAQIDDLGANTRLMLLVAAAETSGELRVVLAAARHLGLGVAELAPAESAGLVTVAGDVIAFRHPLVRTAAYYGAPLSARQAAHGALAEVLRSHDADRLAWHLAASVAGEDEAVAAGLEQAAGRAKERGAYAAAAIAYERAAELTPDPQVRAWRLLAAATAASDAGRTDWMPRLADAAEQLSADPLLRAEIALLRWRSPGSELAERLAELAAAAASIRDEHPRRCAELLTVVLQDGMLGTNPELARKALADLADLAPRLGPLRPAEQAVIEHARISAGVPKAGRPHTRPFVTAIRERSVAASPPERIIASTMAFRLGDIDALTEISAALARDCRDTGLAGWLPGALQGLVLGQILQGSWTDARANAIEGLRLADDIGQTKRAAFLAQLLSLLDALAGDADGCERWITDSRDRVGSPGTFETDWEHARALLDLGRGRFADARRRLEPLFPRWIIDTRFMYEPDLVEAGARADGSLLARQAAARYESWAAHSGQPWAQAVAARCRALVSQPEEAEQHYAEAVRLHAGSGRPFEHARTLLVYGEWLRRARRRSAASDQLQAALAMFDRLGAKGWAQRATSELRATGLATIPVPEPSRLAGLTPQEFQIVKLAAQGVSNRDIGAQMFLSHRTVGYHLYKAFPKLGVTSRHDLAALLG